MTTASAAQVAESFSKTFSVHIERLESIDEVSNFAQAIASAEPNHEGATTGVTMIYIKETNSIIDYSPESIQRFKQTLALMVPMDTFALYFDGNMDETPLGIAISEMYKIVETPTANVHLMKRLTEVPSFDLLRKWYVYYSLATDGYEKAYMSSGRRTHERIVSELAHGTIRTIRMKIRGDPSTVHDTSDDAPKYATKTDTQLLSNRNGAFGQPDDITKLDCRRCGLSGSGCIGHMTSVSFAVDTDITNRRMPTYYYSSIWEKSHLGSVGNAKPSRSYWHAMIRLFCWTCFATDYWNARFVAGKKPFAYPLIRMHPTSPFVPGQPPRHLYTNALCDTCRKPITIVKKSAEGGGKMSIPPVRFRDAEVMHSKYVVVKNPTQVSEKVLMITTLVVREGRPDTVRPMYLSGTMFKTIMDAFVAANPHALDRVNFRCDKMVNSVQVIHPPREYVDTPFEYSAKSGPDLTRLKPATTSLINKPNEQTARGVIEAEHATTKNPKGNGFASDARVTFGNGGRLTILHNRGPIDTCVVPLEFAQTVAVEVPYRGRYQIAQLVQSNQLMAVVDTNGVYHSSDTARVYLETYDVPTDAREISPDIYRIATPPNRPTKQPITMYTPPASQGFTVARVVRTLTDGDNLTVWRNPTTLPGSIVSLRVVVSRDPNVTLHGMLISGPIAKRQGADYDGDEESAYAGTTKRNQEIIDRDLRPAAIIHYDERYHSIAYGLHQDSIFPLYVMSKHKEVYFRVPEEFFGKLHEEYTGDLPVGFNKRHFLPFVPPGKQTYADLSRGVLRNPLADNPLDTRVPVRYVQGKRLIAMLFPRNMVPLPGVIDLSSRDIVLKTLGKKDVNGSFGNITHHIAKLGNDVVIKWITWATFVLGWMNAANLEIAALSVYSVAPTYVPPVDIEEEHANDIAGLTGVKLKRIKHYYHKLRAPPGETVTARVALRYRRMVAWIMSRRVGAVSVLSAVNNGVIQSVQSGLLSDEFNPLATMVNSGARGNKTAFRQYMNGYGNITNGIPPLITPNYNAPNQFARKILYSAAQDGLIAGSFAYGLSHEEFQVLLIISVFALMQTPLSVQEAGTSAKDQAGFTTNVSVQHDNTIVSPAMYLGKV